MRQKAETQIANGRKKEMKGAREKEGEGQATCRQLFFKCAHTMTRIAEKRNFVP